MTEKRFENRLNKNKKYFNTINPVWDNKKENALNVFEMIEELNALHEENQNLKETLWEAEVNYIEERNEFSIDIEKDLEYLKKEWDREYWNNDVDWELEE